MKKTLIAIAALAATSAFAQSSVTVYGVVDAGLFSGKTTAGTKEFKYSGLAQGTLAGPRLGFKGTEDMGNGLKANFVTEVSLNMGGDAWGMKNDGAIAAAGNTTSDGDKSPYNRQTWVGLSSDKAGEVKLGYMNTLQYDHNGPFSAATEGMLGGREHLEILSGQSLTMKSGTTKAEAEANRVAGATYFSPKMNGFQAAVQWGAQKVEQTAGAITTVDSNVKASHSNVSLNYANGPLALGVVQGNSKAEYNTVNLLLSGSANELDTKATSFGASYDLGMAKLFGYMGSRKTTGEGKSTVEADVSRLGVQVPVGNFTVMASMGKIKVDVAGAESQNRDTKQFGAKYAFSKRTTGYALYGSDKDKGTTALTTAAAGVGTDVAATAKSSTIRVGVNHSF